MKNHREYLINHIKELKALRESKFSNLNAYRGKDIDYMNLSYEVQQIDSSIEFYENMLKERYSN